MYAIKRDGEFTTTDLAQPGQFALNIYTTWDAAKQHCRDDEQIVPVNIEQPPLKHDLSGEPYAGAYRIMEQSFKEAQVQLERTTSDLIAWAVLRWWEEVKCRPLDNVHRRALDDTWRQVIRYAGGDDRQLCGPTHDELQQSNHRISASADSSPKP